MRHAFARRVFGLAGIYGLLVLTPQYFVAERLGRDAPPPLTHPEFYHGFIGIALAWQVAFLIVARDPARFRPIMIAAVLEKLAFGVPTVILFLQRRVAATLLGFAAMDLLFVAAYARTRARA
jgi:hypothetical protein